MIDYDGELQLHIERLRAAYDIGATDSVLDIGCGKGQTTREAAWMASKGMALGVDVDEAAIARARALTDLEGLLNARFELGDVQDYPFEVGEFDVAISRFGTMFFDDPRVAFRNVAQAMRASARLVLMVWQVHDRNEWAVSIDRALGRPPGQSVPGPDPFSLGEPAMVRRVLTSAGFTAVTLTAPTDSGLLAKAVNRIAAIGRRIRAAGGAVRTKLRDRSRAAGRRAHDLNANCGPAALPPRRRRRWRWCGARTLSWRIWPRPPPTRPNACCGTRNRAWLRPVTHRRKRPGRPIDFGDQPKIRYRGRNAVERCFNKLKKWRGIAKRSDKTVRHYHAGLCLAATLRWLTSSLSTTS